MVRYVAWALALAACTPAQAPLGRKVTEAMALGGVIAFTGVAIGSRFTTADLVPVDIGLGAITVVGLVGYAILELSVPDGPEPETLVERNHRWAKILTERAAGAARENKCARVKRLEARVRSYDPELHDFVFMRDPEIVRCLQEP